MTSVRFPIRRAAALVLVFAATGFVPACSDDAASSDDANLTSSCSGAALDPKGTCRLKNGHFAKATCCQAEPNVKALVAALETAVEGGDGDLSLSGNNEMVQVSSSDPKAMITAYLEQIYPEDADGFDIVDDSSQFSTDEMVAGTISVERVSEEVHGDIKMTFETTDLADEIPSLQKDAEGAVRSLADAGIVFGFDGFNQNFCAAPTTTLLVLDTRARRVFRVDLTPCDE